MIQFRRGSSENLSKQKQPLADGQPGYDKDRKKIKIGNGKDSWDNLPYASGMSAEEILSSEADAKKRVAKVPGLGLIGNAFNKILTALKLDDRPVFTYGTEAPDSDTVGRVYLQYYDAAPEADYVVEVGSKGIWTYKKWHSGLVDCCGTLTLETTVQNSFDGLPIYSNNTSMDSKKYPFTITDKTGDKAPNETATIHSPGGIVWLASKSMNTTNSSAIYTIISTDKQTTSASYTITLTISGYCK